MGMYPSNRAERRRRRRHKAGRIGLAGIAAAGCAALAIMFSNGAALAADAPAPTPDDCSGPGRVFIVGGTWNSDGSYLVGIEQRYRGYGPTWVKDPNSPYYEDEYTIEPVPYSATIWPLGATGYNASEAEGNAALKQAIAEYQAECNKEGEPPKKVVIAGYSQGSRIAGDVLTDIGQNRNTTVTLANGDPYTIDSTNVSGEIYADPRQSGNLWGAGIENALVGVIPGLTMSGPRTADNFGGVPVTTYCVDGDPICDLPDILHDPIGVADDFLGYWVKHGLYPFYMYLPSTAQSWYFHDTANQMTCTQDQNVKTCVIASKSSTAILTQQLVDSLGIDWEVPDLVADRFRIPEIIGITLADFQTPIAWVYSWLPQLPQLGYGAYLPDLFAFQDTVVGFFTWDRTMFVRGVTALGKSAVSIVLLPVNFTRYWVEQIINGVESLPNSTGSTSALSSVSALSADESSTSDSDSDHNTLARTGGGVDTGAGDSSGVDATGVDDADASGGDASGGAADAGVGVSDGQQSSDVAGSEGAGGAGGQDVDGPGEQGAAGDGAQGDGAQGGGAQGDESPTDQAGQSGDPAGSTEHNDEQSTSPEVTDGGGADTDSSTSTGDSENAAA